jgi:hypothetical protein
VHKLMEPIAIKNIGWGLAVLGVLIKVRLL